MADDKETEHKLLVAEYYELKEKAEENARARQALLDYLPFEIRRLNENDLIDPIRVDRVKAMLRSLKDADHSLHEMVMRANSVATLCGKPEITIISLLSRFGKQPS